MTVVYMPEVHTIAWEQRHTTVHIVHFCKLYVVLPSLVLLVSAFCLTFKQDSNAVAINASHHMDVA